MGVDKLHTRLLHYYPGTTAVWSGAQALDLLSRMLVFNPYKRITVDEALAHPYLAALHDASDEPVAVAPFMFDIDSKLLDKETTQELMWKEVLRYHPGLANTASKC